MKHVSGKLLGTMQHVSGKLLGTNADAQNSLGQVTCVVQGASAQEQSGREESEAAECPAMVTPPPR